ncbi:MAG: hypothetical protein ACTSWR_08155 [Candidatus Helarchaeota archaeon]
MTKKYMSINIIIILLIIQIFTLIPHSNSLNSSKLMVLFDESHNQYFTYSNGNFVSALDYLNQSGNFIVKLNKNGTQLNYTILKNYDILVIPNPGNGTTFTLFEVESIINWTKEGGCLLIMSDYYHQSNLQKRGKPFLLNNILGNLSIPIEFTTADIVDEDQSENYNGEPTLIKINYLQFSNSILGSKISNVIIRSSCINITAPYLKYDGAYGPTMSYYYFSSLHKIYSPPYWLLRFQVGRSLIITCGATEMFSDSINPSIGVKWYSIGDNLRLWVNIFNALALQDNIIVWPFYLILTIVFLCGLLGLFVYNKWFLVKKTSKMFFSIEEINLERSNILKLARQCYSNNDFRNAARYYRRALKISEKLNEQDKAESYREKLNECLKKH